MLGEQPGRGIDGQPPVPPAPGPPTLEPGPGPAPGPPAGGPAPPAWGQAPSWESPPPADPPPPEWRATGPPPPPPGYPPGPGYGYPPPPHLPPYPYQYPSYGQVPITRPGPAPGLVYAGFWIRVGAALLDGAIAFALFVAVALIGGAMASGTSGTGATVGIAVVVIAAVLGYLALQIYIPGRLGATLGMRVTGVWIVREADGSQIGYALATGRFAVTLVIAFLPFGSLADGLLIAFDRRKQAIHDKACSTLCVRRV